MQFRQTRECIVRVVDVIQATCDRAYDAHARYFARGIGAIDWICCGVLIKIHAASESKLILSDPPSRNRIVVTRPEPRQSRIEIAQSACESERLCPGRTVCHHVP